MRTQAQVDADLDKLFAWAQGVTTFLQALQARCAALPPASGKSFDQQVFDVVLPLDDGGPQSKATLADVINTMARWHHQTAEFIESIRVDLGGMGYRVAFAIVGATSGSISNLQDLWQATRYYATQDSNARAACGGWAKANWISAATETAVSLGYARGRNLLMDGSPLKQAGPEACAKPSNVP